MRKFHTIPQEQIDYVKEKLSHLPIREAAKASNLSYYNIVCIRNGTKRTYSEDQILKHREARRRYRVKHPDKTREQAIRWKINNPEKVKLVYKKREQIRRDVCDDQYIKHILKCKGLDQAPKYLIDLQRNALLLKRELKNR